MHWEDPEGSGGEGGGVGGPGWGIHVNPWLIHVNEWQKPLQHCKVISLQLIKINGKKEKETEYTWGHLKNLLLYKSKLFSTSAVASYFQFCSKSLPHPITLGPPHPSQPGSTLSATKPSQPFHSTVISTLLFCAYWLKYLLSTEIWLITCMQFVCIVVCAMLCA